MERMHQDTSNDEKYAIQLHIKEARELEKMNKIQKKVEPLVKNEFRHARPLTKNNPTTPVQKTNDKNYLSDKIENYLGLSDYIPDNVDSSTIIGIIEENKNLNNPSVPKPKNLDMNKRMKVEGSNKNTLRPDESKKVIKPNREPNIEPNDELKKPKVIEKSIYSCKEHKKKTQNEVNSPVSSGPKMKKFSAESVLQAKPNVGKNQVNQLVPSLVSCPQPSKPYEGLGQRIEPKVPSRFEGQNLPKPLPRHQDPCPRPNAPRIIPRPNFGDYSSPPDTYESLLELDKDAYDVGKGFNARDLKKICVSVLKPSSKKITCNICLIDLEIDQKFIILPCVHYYHEDCIKNWLSRKKTCPTCHSEVKLD